MNKTWFIGILFFTWVIGPAQSSAQFLVFDLEIEPELSATTQQQLSFGLQQTGTGRIQVNLGDENMGIFRIKGLVNQPLMIQLETPRFLTHQDPGINSRIPIDLSASYNDTGEDNPFNSIPFNGQTVYIELNEMEGNAGNSVWTNCYIYLYGTMVIENVPDGRYSGNIILNVEYL